MARGVGGHSPSNIMHHLKGVDFPASKHDLLKLAKRNKAEKEVIEVIETMPDEKYGSVAEIMKGIGQAE